jgi:hypothetical protein
VDLALDAQADTAESEMAKVNAIFARNEGFSGFSSDEPT